MSKRAEALMLTPKKTAEWLFIPAPQQCAKSGVKHKDVGLVIESGEVLLLTPTDVIRKVDGRLIISCKEGAIVLIDEEWVPWKKSISSADSVFNMARIIREFEED